MNIFEGSTEVGTLPLQSRLEFLKKTYLHLFGAVLAFVGVSALLSAMGLGEEILRLMGTSRMGWLLVLGAFMGVGYVATALAERATHPAMPYLGLGLYVWADAIIFSPLLFLAGNFYPGTIMSAAVITLLAFTGLTYYVMVSKKDFTFLGPILGISFLIALGAVIMGALVGFSLGIWFSALMVVLSVGAILNSTSKILTKYPSTMHVAASLELFAAVALMFWYVLRILMALRR